MEYRQLGRSGVRVSVIGLGTNRFGGKVSAHDVNEIVAAALDMGVNFIDTADMYTDGNSERTLGAALKGRWDKVVLATKFYFPMGEGTNDRGASRYHIMQAVEASLQRLETDHIDLYYLHRWDEQTPIEETLRALDDLIRGGKVRYLGASALASWQMAHANMLAECRGWTGFAALQSQYHMLERGVEQDVLPYCAAHGVGFVPYYPLAGGFLTGKYRRGEPAPEGSRNNRYVQSYMTAKNFAILEALTAWAQARGHSMVELAEAWLLAQPAVASVISGVTKLSQLEANLKAAEWRLTAEDVAEINAILQGKQQYEA